MNTPLVQRLARGSVGLIVRVSLLAGVLTTLGCGSEDHAPTTFGLSEVLARDATCLATDERLKWTYTYRASTHVLSEAYQPRVAGPSTITGVFESELDDRGLAKYRQERQDGKVVWRHDYTYDEHGRLSRLAYPPLLLEYVNTYDAATGHVLTVATNVLAGMGPNPSLQTYVYVGGRLDQILFDDLAADAFDSTTSMFYEGAVLPSRIEIRRNANPTSVYQALRFSYDDAGRLTVVSYDGGAPLAGADGKNDSYSTWTYRAESDVKHMETDGTNELDNPMIDGTPDHGTDFGDGCRAIGVLRPAIYNYPSVLQ